MSQQLWRDFTGPQHVDWFNFNPFTANIPDTFEIGFSGPGTGSAGSNGDPTTDFDMYTLVLHEMGRALGMSGANTATQNEAGTDLDYDVNPNFIFGEALAPSTLDRLTDFVGHLDATAQLEGVSGGTMTIDVAERLVNNGVIDVDGGAVRRRHDATGWVGHRVCRSG